MGIPFLSEGVPKNSEAPKNAGSHISSHNQVAIVEQQRFLENLYYGDAPKSMNKAITDEMKDLVGEPLAKCIQSPSNSINERRSRTRKQPSSFTDWQAGKAPELSYVEFKALVAQEKVKDATIEEDLLLKEYAVRSISRVLPFVHLDKNPIITQTVEAAARYAVAPPVGELSMEQGIDLDVPLPLLAPEQYSAEQKKRYEDITSRVQKTLVLVEQMEKFGIDSTNFFYERIRRIDNVHFAKEWDMAKTDIMRDYPLLHDFYFEKDTEKGIEILGKMNDLENELVMHISKKNYKILARSEQEDKDRAHRDSELSAEMLDKQYEQAYEYLSSLIPEEDRRFFDKAPYYILKAAIALRRVIPVANAEALAEIWWQLRLGGARAQDIYEHLNKEMPDYVKEQKLKKYTEHLSDNYLSTEAARFEFQKNIKVAEGVSPNQLLYQTMKDLIRHHIPKNQRFVRFTILDGDTHMRKITLPYHEGITDSEIFENITNATATTRWDEINLTERERGELSYKGYTQEREGDVNYNRIYRGFGKDAQTGRPINGDYIIQMGGVYDDSRDPRSLYATDSCKAAVQIRLNKANEATVTAGYNHSYYDGTPAQLHSSSLVTELASLTKTDNAPGGMLKRDTASYLSEIAEYASREESALPLVEARADYIDGASYKRQKVGETYLSSADQRALVVGRANVEYFQQLVAGKMEGMYFERNPNSNNIQPVAVRPRFTRENMERWTVAYRNAIKRASETVGDVALLSSITGTKELPLAYAGKILNPRLTNMLSHAQGMISALHALPGEAGLDTFTTAFSDAYRPEKIDLNDPVPSMGVVAMYLRKDGASHYTARLLPSQAQKQFREAALNLCTSHSSASDQWILLEEFNEIIKAWDRLVGGLGRGHTITLGEYEKKRDKVLDSLISKGLIDENSPINTGEKLQVYLNTAFRKAAQDVFDSQKLESTKKELEALIGA